MSFSLDFDTLFSCSQQATTLRLMANAYLDWDSKQHWQLALNAVGELSIILVNDPLINCIKYCFFSFFL